MAVNGRRPTKSSPSLTYNGATINLLALSASLISRLNDGEMVTTISDDMFAPDVIRDPFRYYGRIRDEDPVHWNELYQLWVITRHDDLVWLARNHEQFSNSVWKNDPTGIPRDLRLGPRTLRLHARLSGQPVGPV